MLNILSKLFDTRSPLQVAANDRNLILTGYDSNWMVLDADGNILSTGSNQADTLAKAIFTGNSER